MKFKGKISHGNLTLARILELGGCDEFDEKRKFGCRDGVLISSQSGFWGWVFDFYMKAASNELGFGVRQDLNFRLTTY